jgi:hypothetical protein
VQILVALFLALSQWVQPQPMRVADAMGDCLATGGAPIRFVLPMKSEPMVEALVMTSQGRFNIIYIKSDRLGLNFYDGIDPSESTIDEAYQPLVIACIEHAMNVLYPPATRTRVGPHDVDDLVRPGGVGCVARLQHLAHEPLRVAPIL